MAMSVAQRVQKRRNALRMAGLRPVQIWVPDTRRPGFEAECRHHPGWPLSRTWPMRNCWP